MEKLREVCEWEGCVHRDRGAVDVKVHTKGLVLLCAQREGEKERQRHSMCHGSLHPIHSLGGEKKLGFLE